MNEQARIINQPQLLNMNQNHQIINMGQQQMVSHQHRHPQQSQQSQPQIMVMKPPLPESSQGINRSYGAWAPSPVDQLNFQNPMIPPPVFGSSKQLNTLGRNNWKGKKGNVKRKDGRRKDMATIAGSSSCVNASSVVASNGAYNPPTLNELQHQNRLKARRFFPKKKFNNRFSPLAPRNTTSFLIRAKKSGGIASLVSPCPVTPAVLPTPIFSPSREVLVDMAKEEWGVDGYGSMKGLIRLRSPGNEADEDEEEEGSSASDVEEHVEVERRLDHDLSRFEMIYPNTGAEYNNVLENRVDDQDTHIAQLEEENLILKERLFLMERELGDLRRRLQCLERQNLAGETNEEVVENGFENEAESQGVALFMEDNEVEEENIELIGGAELKEDDSHFRIETEKRDNEGEAYEKETSKIDVKAPHTECAGDLGMDKATHALDELTMCDDSKGEASRKLMLG